MPTTPGGQKVARGGRKAASKAGQTLGPIRARHGLSQDEVVKRILNASEDLLVSKGLPAFSSNAIAALAGVDLGTLLRKFPDKTAILVTLFERNERECREQFGAARAIVEAASALMDYGQLHPKEAKAMARELTVLLQAYLVELAK